jgi:hypothetical protein
VRLIMAAAGLLGMLASIARAQPPVDSTGRDSKALRRAQGYAEVRKAVAAGHMEKATAILRAFAEESTSTGSDWVHLAEFLLVQQRDSEAVSWYRFAYTRRDRLAPAEVRAILPQIAAGELRLGRPAEALQILLQARAARQIDERDARILYLLGSAWETLEPDRARCAIAAAIEAAPLESPFWEEWNTLNRNQPAPALALMSSDRWECPASPNIGTVLRFGPASQWRSEDLIPRAAAYLRTADTLAALGHGDVAKGLRYAAWWIPYYHARRLVRQSTSEESADTSLAFFALANASQPANLDAGRRAGALQDIIAGYRRLGKFEHAMGAAEQLFQLCRPENGGMSRCQIDSIPAPPFSSRFVETDSSIKPRWDRVLEINTAVLGRLLTDAFIYVSWDRRTAQLRDQDPGNFMGHTVTETTRKGRSARGASVAGRPYGQTSVDEDRVTVQTSVMMMSEQDLSRDLATAMSRAKYGLVTKVLIARLLLPTQLGIVPDVTWAQRDDLYGVKLSTLDSLTRAPNVAGLTAETRTALRTALDAVALVAKVHDWYAGSANLSSKR